VCSILFVTWDGGGNVPPALAIARELQGRGAAVRFLGHARQRQMIESAGFPFEQYSNPGSWTATDRRSGLQNVTGFLAVLCGRSLGADALASIAVTPTDVVVVDCLLFGVLDALDRTGVPRAVLVHSLYTAVERTMFAGAPGIVAKLRGLNPRRLFSRADRVLVATLKALDSPSAKAPVVSLSYVGAMIPPSKPSTPGDTKRVLVSLSTTYVSGQGAALQRILNALARLPIEVVVTTGPAVDPASLSAPANATVLGYQPHADVMPGVDLVVGHGGHATTVLALAHDLPLVILPMNPSFDQPIIAKAIEQAGAGIALPKTASDTAIRGAVEKVLADATYCGAASNLGAQIRAVDSPARAADEIQEIAGAANRPTAGSVPSR
jgi:UDP:flavonoid glycosyltransferase YjiC (YdhE family)